jgi:hypothetical protein
MSTTTNVEKLVAAKLVEEKDIGPKERAAIDNLSHHEVDAIISAAHKMKKLVDAGEQVARIWV